MVPTACLFVFFANFHSQKCSFWLWKVLIALQINCVKLKTKGAFESQQVNIKLPPLRPIQSQTGLLQRYCPLHWQPVLSCQFKGENWDVRTEQSWKQQNRIFMTRLHEYVALFWASLLSKTSMSTSCMSILCKKCERELKKKERESKNSKTLLVGGCVCRCSFACLHTCVCVFEIPGRPADNERKCSPSTAAFNWSNRPKRARPCCPNNEALCRMSPSVRRSAWNDNTLADRSVAGFQGFAVLFFPATAQVFSP